MDGCTPYGIFFKIVLPLLKPIISTLVIINAVNIWNDFFNPLMFMSGKAGRTITLAVYMFKGQYSTQWNVLFAGLVLATLPMMIVYFVLQKYDCRHDDRGSEIITAVLGCSSGISDNGQVNTWI